MVVVVDGETDSSSSSSSSGGEVDFEMRSLLDEKKEIL